MEKIRTEYMVLFFTHSAAIKFERQCRRQQIDCELMPVPRVLSSNCSISAKVKVKTGFEDLINDGVEKIFAIRASQYELVYESQY